MRDTHNLVRRVGAAVALLVAMAVCAPAVGHGGRPVPRKLYVDPEGQLLAVVSSNLGLHVSDDGGSNWYWICEDIVGFDVVDFALSGPVGDTASDRVWLAGGMGISQDANLALIPGLYRSTDGGCNWAPVGGDFGEQWASGLSVHPNSPERVIVTTHHLTLPNGIAVSGDSGASWTWVVQDPDVKFGTLRRAPSNPDVLYAHASRWIVRSDDDGASWTRVLEDIVIDDVDELAVHAIDPEDHDTVYFSRRGFDSRWLYVTRDGGATSEVILQPETGEFQSATVIATDALGGRMILVGASFGEVLRSVNGGATWDSYLADVESIDCLEPDYTDPGAAWVCSNPYAQIVSPGETPTAIGRTRDGAETVEKFFSYTDTTDFWQCDNTSQFARVCVGQVQPDTGAGPDAGADVGIDADTEGGSDTDELDAGLDAGSDGMGAPPGTKGRGCSCRMGDGAPFVPVDTVILCVCLLLFRRAK